MPCLTTWAHSCSAVVLPKWTMLSLKGVQKQSHACSCQGCKATNHTETLRNLLEPASRTYTNTHRNYTSTHRNSPEPFWNLPPEPTPAHTGTLRNLPPEPTPAHTGTLRNLLEPAPRTYTSTHRNSPAPASRTLPIGSLSLETSATASCGRYVNLYYDVTFFRKHLFPQQRKLMGSSAQISSGVCRCRSEEQVPEEGSRRFRRVPVCAGVGSGGRFWSSGVCWWFESQLMSDSNELRVK